MFDVMMHRIKVITLFALVLVFVSGCGTKRKAMKRAEELRDEQMLPPRDHEQKMLYPIDYEGERVEYVDKEAVGDEEYGMQEPLPEALKVRFSERESANIRVVGINPLPSGGVLKVNLDEISEEFCFPYKGEFLSDYGNRGRAVHTGVDIRTALNDTIRSILSGVVRMSKSYGSYGNIVVVQHPQGFETLYSHCSKNLVAVNEVVRAGQPIALGGRTGRATTEHLHFEVRVAGEHVDPNKLIDVRNHKLKSGMFYVGEVDGRMLAYNTPSEGREIADNLRAEERALEESQARAAEQRKREVEAAEKEAAKQHQYHTVKSGDTLYGIALRNKTTVKKLCELNNIRENSILQINQRIRIR